MINKGTVVLLLFLLCAGMASAHAPDQFVKIDYATEQQFSASMPAETYAFYSDGVLEQSSASNTFNDSWSESGQHNVTVVASTGESYTWFPWVFREAATTGDSVSQIENSFNELEDGVEEGDYGIFISGIDAPYQTAFGGIYYLIILGLPFFMLFRRQESLLVPSIIGLITGTIVLGMMPEDYRLYLQAGILLSAGATFWTLYRER